MLSELLKSSTIGLGAYPVVSLVIFFIVFVVASWKTIKVDKSYCEEMSSMPLRNDDAVNRDLED